eukprot:m.187174 g.187174  ORF g.187174 m.187174 type:complete len:407 (+) comp14770_c0_seq1:203-1423(+)
MFAFPYGRPAQSGGYYGRPTSNHYDPYTTAPTRRQRAPPRQASYDPFTSLFGGPSSMYRDEDAYLQQRKQEQLRRQQLLREQELKRQQAIQEKQRRYKQYHDAATVIQKAFRAYKQRQQQETKAQASLVVTRAIRRAGAVRVPKLMAASLRTLQKKQAQLQQTVSSFYSAPRGYRNVLQFVDTVEKLILSLDEVPHYRSEFVRGQRKSLVKDAQAALRFADVVQRTQSHKAHAIATWWKAAHSTRVTEQQTVAAQRITTFLRAVPLIQHARRVRATLAEVKAKQAHLATLREQYLAALNDTATFLDAQTDSAASVSSSPSPTLDTIQKELQDKVTADITALTQATKTPEQPTAPKDSTTTTTATDSTTTTTVTDASSAPIPQQPQPSSKSGRKNRRKSRRRGQQHG